MHGKNPTRKTIFPLRQSWLDSLATARVLHRAPHLAAEECAVTLRLEWKNNLKSYRKENINVVSIRGLAILFIWIHINKDWFDLTFLLQIL